MRAHSRALIISCFTALASVSSLCMATFAWIIELSNVSLSYASVTVMRGEEAIVEPSIIKYDLEGNAAIDATEDEDALTLSQYDAIITSTNAYNPIYVIAVVSPTSSREGIYTCTVTAETEAWLVDGSTTEMAPYISNLIQFKAAASSTSGFENLDASDLSTFYTSIQSAFETVTTFSTFLSYDASSGVSIASKSTSIDILSSLSAPCDGSSSVTFYIEIDYNDDLVEYFYTNRSGFTLGDVSGESIDFLTDVSSFLFGVSS